MVVCLSALPFHGEETMMYVYGRLFFTVPSFIVCIAFYSCSSNQDGYPPLCDVGQTADNGCSLCTCVAGRWDCPQKTCNTLTRKAGFIEIEPIVFSLTIDDVKKTFTSSTARLWYAFQPAAEAPQDKPLVVFYNGGPGSSTSAILFGYNTAGKTLDPNFNGGQNIGQNPHAWTELANLLYIDARDTGFSYNLMEHPENSAGRQAEFSIKNFNSMFDGADIVRVILRFLAMHKSIQKNPVVLVGESYAGIRNTAALHLLLHYKNYAQENSFYRDVALADEIQSHFDEVFPNYKNQIVPAHIVAQQFGRQVMLQALISGRYQLDTRKEIFESADSPLYDLAEQTNSTFVPCHQKTGDCHPLQNAYAFIRSVDRDPYNISKNDGWVYQKLDDAVVKLNQLSIVSEHLGINVTTVDWLNASQRRFVAYRVGDPSLLPPESYLKTYDQSMELSARFLRFDSPKENYDPNHGDLHTRLGVLTEWDRYFMSLNDDIYNAFYSDQAFDFQIDPFNPRFGRLFLHNLLYVKTFVTQSAFDYILYALTIPKALGLHTNLVSKSEHDTTPRPGIERSGWIHVTYLPNVFDDQPEQSVFTIRFPHYSQAGHTITIDQPGELLQDVKEWLSDD